MKILRTCMIAVLCLALCGAMLVGYVAYLVPVSAASVAEGDAVIPVGEDVEALGYLGVTATYENPAKMVADYTSDEMMTVDLRGYCIVTQSNAVTNASFEVLKARMSNLTGEEVDYTHQYSGSFTGRLRRIVITTEDRYAENARKGYENKDFVIRVMSQQVVIIGKNDACCELALQYFLENYLPADAESYEIELPRVTTGMLNATSITIGKPATTTKDSEGTVTYGSDGVANAWQIVFDNDLDHDGVYDEKGASSGNPDIYGAGNIANDARYDKLASLQSWMNTVTNKGEVYTLVGDTTAAVANEILVGDCNRDEVRQALAMINETEFIVAVINGKIVATGHTYETQMTAIDVLTSMIVKGGYFKYHPTDSKANRPSTGVVAYEAITVPSNLCFIAKAKTTWIGEAEGVVLPDGLTLTDVIDVSNNDLQYLYAKKDEIDENDFTAYCQKLLAAGFVEIASNTVSGSHFKTFVNYQTCVMMQVDYNAFAKTGEALGTGYNASGKSNSNNNGFNEVVFSYAWPTIRITTNDLLSADMPQSGLLNPNQSYTKVVDSTIVSMDLGEGSYGTGYVMQLEDGRFVMVDGGAGEDANITNLWNILTEMHTAATGSAPSASNPVEIAAWIGTHGHGDHVGMLQNFSKSSYATSGLVKLRYLIVTFPSRTEINQVGEASVFNYKSFCSFSDYEFVKPVTGQTLYIANLKIETLFTHRDIYPQRTVAMNDTSTIQRLSFVATSATSGAVELDHATTQEKSFSFMSTGDLYIQGSRWLCAMYGKDLKADMVSMAHHGGPGAESAFYDNVAPTVVWWSYAKDSIQITKSGTPSSWNVNVNNYVFKTLSSVKYILIADDCNLSVKLSASTDLTNLGSKPTAVAVGDGQSVPTSFASASTWAYSKSNPAVKR